jgi:hypothetical protein
MIGMAGPRVASAGDIEIHGMMATDTVLLTSLAHLMATLQTD